MKKLLLLTAAFFVCYGLTAQTAGNTPRAIRMVDKQLSLSGMFNEETSQSFIGLEAGDKIIVNCFRLSKKGNASISIKDLNQGNEIYKRDGFDTLRDVSIPIPAKGIYVVDMKTGSLLGKDVKLAIDRIPSSSTSHGTKITPKGQMDTTSVEVVNTTVRAFSKNSPQSNNTTIAINLPANTTYWVYWIGAGKEAKDKMKAFTASCSTIGNLFPSEPLVLYGRKFLSSLPMTKSNASISYHFMDTNNTTAFKNKQQFSFYMFKSSERITTEYAMLKNNQTDLNLGISNESSSLAQDVEVHVVAFIVKPH